MIAVDICRTAVVRELYSMKFKRGFGVELS